MALTISATDTEVRKPVNAVYKENLLRNARPLAPYFVGTQPGVLEKQAGTATCKWRRFPTDADPAATAGGAISLTTSALSELTGNAAYGQGQTPDTVGFTDVTAAVSKYGQFYLLNEEVDLFNPNGTMMGITTTLGISAGRSLNALQRDIGEENSTQLLTGSSTSEGAITSKITASAISLAVLTLTGNSATPFSPMSEGSTTIGSSPLLPGYWGICHPHQAYDVARLAGFTSVEKYASHVDTVPGEFGAVGDAGFTVRCIQTPDASIDLDAGGTKGSTGLRGTSDVDLYTFLVYGQDAIGSVGLGESHGDGIYRAGDSLGVIEILASEKQASPGDPFAEVTSLAWKAWHGGAVLNGNWSRSIRSGATNVSA